MPLKAKAGILEISPYIGGESDLKNKTNIHKLSSNEAALGPSPKAVEAIKIATQNIHRYPEGSAYELRQTLGQKFNLDMQKIICGNGSDEILTLLMQAFAGAGDEVIYSKHGFLMYPITALAMGARPIAANEKYYTTHIDSLLSKVTHRTKIVFIANPNNPTGTYIAYEELKRLRDNLDEDILLVIDAAYAEFVTKDDYDAGVKLVDNYDNVVMTRTFSKAFALGGIRLGWCYAPLEVIDILNRIRGPFNVNHLALAAAVAALNDDEHLQKTINHTLYWRKKMTEALHAIKLNVLESQCNFILIRFKDEKQANAADTALKAHGVIVRKMGAYHLPEALRITIGNEVENQTVLDILTKFKKESVKG